MSNLCNILVVGVGNSWRRDDGIGPAVINILKKNPKENVDYFDGGIDSLALLDKLQQYKRVIIIDAVHMGSQPGTVKLFVPHEAKLIIKTDALSTHGFGLAELLKLLEQLEVKLKLQIIGVEPEDISFGNNLTATITQKLPDIVKLITEIL